MQSREKASQPMHTMGLEATICAYAICMEDSAQFYVHTLCSMTVCTTISYSGVGHENSTSLQISMRHVQTSTCTFKKQQIASHMMITDITGSMSRQSIVASTKSSTSCFPSFCMVIWCWRLITSGERVLDAALM